jgi:hypothetical protein
VRSANGPRAWTEWTDGTGAGILARVARAING